MKPLSTAKVPTVAAPDGFKNETISIISSGAVNSFNNLSHYPSPNASPYGDNVCNMSTFSASNSEYKITEL